MPSLPRVGTAALVSVALAAALLGAAAPARHAIYAIGDSWAAGLYSDPAHALIQDAAADLGAAATVDAESGSGYLAAPGSTRTYLERAERIPAGTRADLVIVQGGSNDDHADLADLPDAVARTVRAVRAALPHARIVLLGPGPDPWPVTALQREVDGLIGAAAGRLGVQYVSPFQEGWFTVDDVDDIIDPVTGHPTVEGDAVLGARLAADLRRHLPAGRGHRPVALRRDGAERVARSRGARIR